MGYINEVEHEVRKLIASSTTDEVVKFIKLKTLESYYNGVEVGARGDKKLVDKAKRFAKKITSNK